MFINHLIMKKNIILVNPSLSTTKGKIVRGVYPLTGILLLGTILKHKYKVTIIDGNLYPSVRDCFQAVQRNINKDTIFVGFSVMTCQIPWALTLTKLIKAERAAVNIVWGGVHPTLFPIQTIKSKYIDVVAVNESTSISLKLASALERGKSLASVPGVYYIRNGRAQFTKLQNPDNLSKMPFIDFSLIDYKKYSEDNILDKTYNADKKTKTFIIVTGLGCAYRCTFCINTILKRKYRFRSAEEIIARVEYLQKKYNANFFEFLDEDFFISRKRILKLLDLIEDKNLKFKWRAWVRVDRFNKNYITPTLAKRLEKNGLTIAVMGGECGTQRMLDDIQKDIKVEDILRATATLNKTKIIPRMSFMVGLPGERNSEIIKTYNLAIALRKINKNVDLQIYSFRLYPGSQIYEVAKQKYCVYEPTELESWVNEDFSSNYGYLSYEKTGGIENITEFKKMRKLCDYFILGSYNEKGVKRFRKIFRKITELRFKHSFFDLCFSALAMDLLRKSKIWTLLMRPS